MLHVGRVTRIIRYDLEWPNGQQSYGYVYRPIKGVDQPHIAAHDCKRLDIYAPSQWCQ